MSLTLFGGQGLWSQNIQGFKLGPPEFNAAVIDATGEKVAWIGRVRRPDGAGGDIRRVQFMFGTVVKAGGSALTLSLQNVSASTGSPGRPDETQDQTVAIANADASFASDTWYRSGTLSADRTVAASELIAVVLEYDGSGRLSSDSVTVNNFNSGYATIPMLQAFVAHKTGGSWGSLPINCVPNLLLEFSDGVIGTLDGSFPAKATGATTYTASDNPDEYALQFTPSVPCTIDGAFIEMGAGNSDLFDVILYQGTTALQTISYDADTLSYESTSFFRGLYVPIPPTDLTASTTYYLALKAGSAGVALSYFDVNDNTHLAAHGLGATAYLNTRNNGGAWGGGTNTRRPWIALRFSKFDSGGVSGGGGPPANLLGGIFQ